jgi:cholesterol transport system auxiliary component
METSYERKAVIQLFNAIFLSFTLTACAQTPPQTYDLTALPSTIKSSGAKNSQIIIYEPTVIALYDSERVVIKGINQGFTYLPNTQWADRLPKLVQSRLIQSFENTSRYKSVGRPSDRISAGTLLTTEIRAFEISEETREAVVEISAKQVGQNSGRVENTRIFKVIAPVSSIDGSGSTAALDAALQTALSQIVNWAR